MAALTLSPERISPGGPGLSWPLPLRAISLVHGISRPSSPPPPAPRASTAVSPGEATLIARVRAGDEDAARLMVDRLYPTIIKSIRCHLPRRTSEEDLAQAIFAKVFK